MDISGIVRHTFENGGGTFGLYRSGSAYVVDSTVIDFGYFVGHAYGIPAAEISVSRFTAQSVRDFRDEHFDKYTIDESYLGTWIDNGIVYLDVTKHYVSLADALAMGEWYGEQAIWDVANSVAIPVPATVNA